MKLWIRSQNKEILMKCDDIALDENRIVGYFNKDTEYEELGIYETKERAIEVLDKIQEILMLCIKSNGNERLVGTSCYVYEMPEE